MTTKLKPRPAERWCICGCGASVAHLDVRTHYHPDCKNRRKRRRDEAYRNPRKTSTPRPHMFDGQPPRTPVKRCNTCGDLSHRRDVGGCPECGRQFAPEKRKSMPPVIGSSMAAALRP